MYLHMYGSHLFFFVRVVYSLQGTHAGKGVRYTLALYVLRSNNPVTYTFPV